MLSGHFIATVVVAAGVGGLVANSPIALTVLTIAGAGYLLWLGVNMLLKPATPHAGEAESASSWGKWAAKGLCISGMNPKVFLLFLALLPQFASTQATWPLPAQMLALGMLHIVSCGAVYLLVGYGAERLLKARPAAAKAVSRFSGGAMVVISFILIGEQIYSHWMV
jgi:threonine/homoserine/homoserine lactone efflux protein